MPSQTTYTTTQEIKNALSIVSTNHDKLLDKLRETAYTFINEQLGYTHNPSSSSTRLFHAVDNVRNHNRDLITGYLHTITNVTNGDNVVITSNQYIVVENRILRLKQNLGLTWSWSAKDDPTNAISITAYFGISGLPHTVVYLEEQLVIHYYRSLDTSIPMNIALVSNSILMTPAALPIHIQQLIERLRPLI